MDKDSFMALRKYLNEVMETMNSAQIESIAFMLEAELMDRDIETLEEVA